jgi:hypothetical protein
MKDHVGWEAAVKEGYAAQRQFVGVDLARQRSVIARMDPDGVLVDCVQADTSSDAFVAEVAKAGAGAPVALEATFGWYWAVDALQAAGHEVHLAHPKGMASMHNRRVKTDARDAAELAWLLCLGEVAESWIAPPRCGGCGSWSGTGTSWSRPGRRSRPACMRCWAGAGSCCRGRTSSARSDSSSSRRPSCPSRTRRGLLHSAG